MVRYAHGQRPADGRHADGIINTTTTPEVLTWPTTWALSSCVEMATWLWYHVVTTLSHTRIPTATFFELLAILLPSYYLQTATTMSSDTHYTFSEFRSIKVDDIDCADRPVVSDDSHMTDDDGGGTGWLSARTVRWF
jgi:hypothetical protein